MRDADSVISAFSEEDAAKLTGVSVSQLRYYRKEDISGQLVLEIPSKVASGDMGHAVRPLRAPQNDTIGRIARRRNVAGNKPVIAGTRIPVKSIKAFHEAGYSVDQIREQYPSLTSEDIEAAIAYSEAA